jgi:type I restriction enzyme S subunit
MSTSDTISVSVTTKERTRYSEYEDANLDWLDEIPEHWRPIRLRYLAETSPSKTEVRDRTEDSEVSFVPMDSVGANGGLDLSETKELSDVIDGYTYFRDGDVLVAKITPCFENRKGALADGLVNGIGFGTTELHVLRPSPQLDKRFLFYATLTHPFRKLGESTMYGAGGQKRVSDDFIRDLTWPIPPLDEQRAIATYLDRETEHIDALIDKKQRLIDLLEEKRTALISRAVTEGLDDDVEMQDSGVEWLGEIPAHWDTVKLKFLSPTQTVGVVQNPSSYFDPEGAVPFILGNNISVQGIDVEEAPRITEESNRELQSTMLRAGDLVAVRVGDPGVTAVIPPELDRSNCGSVLIIRQDEDFNSTWLAHVMNSRVGEAQIDIVEYGAAQRQFNLGHAVNFRFPVPPKDEQNEIARYLDRKAEHIDSLVDKVRDAIDRLKEYRTALISAAVTGKIDVRDKVEAATESGSHRAPVESASVDPKCMR